MWSKETTTLRSNEIIGKRRMFHCPTGKRAPAVDNFINLLRSTFVTRVEYRTRQHNVCNTTALLHLCLSHFARSRLYIVAMRPRLLRLELIGSPRIHSGNFHANDLE